MDKNIAITTKNDRVKNWLHSLGPGLITAAFVFGPGKMTITSKPGSAYGFSLIWIVMISAFFMFIFFFK